MDCTAEVEKTERRAENEHQVDVTGHLSSTGQQPDSSPNISK